MVGARANGRLVTIDYVIQNGDRIEIITSQNSKGPSLDWLKLVKSAQARSKINQWFKTELKEDNINRGKELMINYCKAHSLAMSDLLKQEYMQVCMQKYGFKDWDSICAAIGHGGLKEGQIVNKLAEEKKRKEISELTDEDILDKYEDQSVTPVKTSRSKGGIVVKGIHDVAVHFSKCCSPVPGDEIVGFVTRGRGISVHRTDCINVMNLPEEDRKRLIEAEWSPEATAQTDKLYTTEIKIYANNRSGLLIDVSRVFTEAGLDITSVSARTNKQGIATLDLMFEIKGRNHLTSLTSKLRNLDGVIDIERTTG